MEHFIDLFLGHRVIGVTLVVILIPALEQDVLVLISRLPRIPLACETYSVRRIVILSVHMLKTHRPLEELLGLWYPFQNMINQSISQLVASVAWQPGLVWQLFSGLRHVWLLEISKAKGMCELMNQNTSKKKFRTPDGTIEIEWSGFAVLSYPGQTHKVFEIFLVRVVLRPSLKVPQDVVVHPTYGDI